jgi:nicotinamide-nucleotide amidase
MWTPELLQLSGLLGERLQVKGWRLTTAESCTGGALAALITEIPGSSHWFECGFVTYSNQSKQQMLGVQGKTLEQQGAVSQAVVEQMAQGAIQQSQAQIAVAISGVAGPGGGTAEKPVGTVWLAWVVNGAGVQARCFQFPGNRTEVRLAALEQALQGLLGLTG